jgi:hypothetical protein
MLKGTQSFLHLQELLVARLKLLREQAAARSRPSATFTILVNGNGWNTFSYPDGQMIGRPGGEQSHRQSSWLSSLLTAERCSASPDVRVLAAAAESARVDLRILFLERDPARIFSSVRKYARMYGARTGQRVSEQARMLAAQLGGLDHAFVHCVRLTEGSLAADVASQHTLQAFMLPHHGNKSAALFSQWLADIRDFASTRRNIAGLGMSPPPPPSPTGLRHLLTRTRDDISAADEGALIALFQQSGCPPRGAST